MKQADAMTIAYLAIGAQRVLDARPDDTDSHMDTVRDVVSYAQAMAEAGDEYAQEFWGRYLYEVCEEVGADICTIILDGQLHGEPFRAQAKQIIADKLAGARRT